MNPADPINPESVAPPAPQAMAWFTDDHLSDKSATTYDIAVAERWWQKGWPVTPLYTAPPAPAAPAGGQPAQGEAGSPSTEYWRSMAKSDSYPLGERVMYWEIAYNHLLNFRASPPVAESPPWLERALAHAINCESLDAKLNRPDYELAALLLPRILGYPEYKKAVDALSPADQPQDRPK